MVKRGMRVMKPYKPPENDDPAGTTYRCSRCGKRYPKQKGNFPISHSSLYGGNNYYLTWCYKCVDELYLAYQIDVGLGVEGAIRRMCSRFDYYWNEDVFNTVETSPATSVQRFRDYVRRISGNKYLNMTYDNTLAELAVAELAQADLDKEEIVSFSEENERVYDGITEEIMAFWGAGMEPGEYRDLQASYDRWVATGKYDSDDPAIQTMLKQVCMTEYDIAVARRTGKATDKLQATLNTYLGSLNAKPSQQKEQAAGLGDMPFGVGIQKWEETRPIPEPSDEWKDVDGIIHYITTWFIGQMCKMLKIENKYSELCDAEFERFTVTRPEYDDDDGDDNTIGDILDRAISNDKV